MWTGLECISGLDDVDFRSICFVFRLTGKFFDKFSSVDDRFNALFGPLSTSDGLDTTYLMSLTQVFDKLSSVDNRFSSRFLSVDDFRPVFFS